MSQNVRSSHDDLIRERLIDFGFQFDPFEHLEASTDRRLLDYTFDHNLLQVVFRDGATLIFAPAGGGKTAMRLATAQKCWVASAGVRYFPISYLLSAQLTPRYTSLSSHQYAIVEAAASALFLSLIARPGLFLSLSDVHQAEVVHFLDVVFEGALAEQVSILEDTTLSCEELPFYNYQYYPALRLPEPSLRKELCSAIYRFAAEVPLARPDAPVLFGQMCQILLETLGYQSIFILVDGVDAAAATIHDTQAAVEWLAPLLLEMGALAEHNVFFKGYFPVELQSAINARFVGGTPPATSAVIEWSPELLARIVKRRIWAATRRSFDSFDAIAAPPLEDVEQQLASAVPPLPRELIVLVKRVLFEYARRTVDQRDDYLTVEDIEQAVYWYQNESQLIPML